MVYFNKNFQAGLFMSVQSPNSVAFSRCCQRYHTCVGFAENTSLGQLNTYNLISHKYKDRFLYFNDLCMSLLVLYKLLSTTADAPSYWIINFHEFPIPVFFWELKKLASILLSYLTGAKLLFVLQASRQLGLLVTLPSTKWTIALIL